MKIEIKEQIFIVTLTLSLTGCGTLFSPRVDDLKFTSATVTDLIEEPVIDWHANTNRPSLLLLKINFESSHNLVEVSRNHEFNLSNITFFCTDKPDEYGGLGHFSRVYVSNGAIKTSNYGNQKLKQIPKEGMYQYFIFVDLARTTRHPQQNMPFYDLRKSADDICVRVHGGNMIGMYFDSNVFTIPSMAISEAIKSWETSHKESMSERNHDLQRQLRQ